jgi:GNAT superfamily N-acetyltransferase
MDINIRPATLHDLDVLLQFEQGLIQAELPMDDLITTSQTIHYYDIPGLIVSEHILLLVAETGSRVIGCGYGKTVENPVWMTEKQHGYIGFMFVEDAYRGQGISKQIIARLCDWFRTKNLKEVRLQVYEKNPAAIKSYQGSGFKELRRMMRKEL